MRKIAVTLAFVTFCICALAQPKSLYFEHLNVVQGLPESQITALHQDKLGYVWVGTQNGLVRYDGYKVKVYKLGSDIKGSIKDFAVDDIYEAKDGELWITSRYNSIFHYNRAADSFEQYKLNKQYSRFGFKNIIIDNDGYIWPALRSWYGMFFTGGNLPAAARLSIKTHREEKFPYAVASLIICKSGLVWLGTDKGLVYYDRSAGKMSKVFFPLSSNGKQYLISLYEAPSEPGILWFNVVDSTFKSSGLYSFNTRTYRYKKYTPNSLVPGAIASPYISGVYEDKRHRLWFGTRAGLSLFDRVSGNFKNYTPPKPLSGLKENPVTNIAEQPDGKLWLASYLHPQFRNGLLLFDPSDGTFRRYTHDERKPYSLNIDQVSGVMVDRTGSLWVAMAWGGLDRVNNLHSQFDTYLPGTNDKSSYPAGGAIGATLAPDGYCWLGSKEGLIRWRPNTDLFERVDLPSYIKKNTAQVLSADKDGLIWCAAAGTSLFTYDPKTAKTDTLGYPGKWSSTTVLVVYQDHAGLIWVGTAGRGLYCYNKHTRKFTAYPCETNPNGPQYKGRKLDDSYVVSIYEDRQGVLWVGTNIGGLNRFNQKDGTFTSFFDMTKGLHSVIQIYEDRAGRFWVGTYLSGLFLFDRTTGQSKQFTTKDGLLDDDIESLREDPNGSLWITCQRGFTRFDPANNTYVHYTTNNALPFAFEKERGNTFIKTADNEFVNFVRNGVVSFYPVQMHKNADPPEVQIETMAHNDPRSKDAQINTENLYDNQQVELPHSQNRISFNYVALHFENPEQNQYAYQLVGYDKNWVQVGSQRSVTYNNLSPGTYTFKVKASNSDGVWNEKGASVRVIIYPPWWLTWWAWVLYVTTFVAAIWGFIQFRSRKLLHNNRVLEQKVQERTDEVIQQKEEIESQRDELEKAFIELKSTQTQLIQSEKMASLGELTAGIAHEIQNPLNFVNNFSEVSAELIEEMDDEMDKGDVAEAKAISADIKQNLEKIRHHGQRADAIVKGMLQHSRVSSGQKEPTDLNALADEYLRLAYHGLRAKNKDFNAELVTHFDEKLPKISVIPQDIGRVLLNVINNAFYAAQQKAKTVAAGYKPTVEITTGQQNGSLIVSVKDNGNGIPEAIKDKIMQPFFTTKPTGEGTGLGLSLSYDIVVKGHGGKIDVKSVEGSESEFKITLPLN